MSIAYRIRQFWRLLRARPLPENAWRDIKDVLSPAELALFRRQSAGDCAHGFRVMKTLKDAGETDRRLLAAALLHDLGKSLMDTTTLDRVVGALGEQLFPERATRWGMASGQDWRRPFVIRQQHARWGADLASNAGSQTMTVNLIRHHQDPPEKMNEEEARRLLAKLQWADNQH